MLQLSRNPPIGFSPAGDSQRLSDREWRQPWTAAYCKPRQEKALAWDLLRRGTAYFLPMVLRETSSGGRRRRNFYPLFPSYLFLVDGEAERLAALKTERVVRLVKVDAAQQPRLRGELMALETALRISPGEVELYRGLPPGTPVRVTAGPLKGVEGVVLEAERNKKLWLGVTALGVGATIEIHPDLVCPL